ncbi:MAG: MgtC/SapB family protein [Sphingomonadaceae bacterium]|nr:MgtC/SapB family protein [Sphingomonadaceae bacterium]
MIGDPLLRSAAAFALAFALGAAIGLERQLRQRTAGLRTNVLVALGAAAFVDLGVRISGADGAARIASYVVSGIGFLGAGVIMKEGAQVRGLNTAATLWASAAVGCFCGAGELGIAALLAAFVLAGNTLLRPLVDWVNRRPFSRETEALYRVFVVTRPAFSADARDLLDEELERAGYPVREVEVVSEGEETVELAAQLAPTTADPAELDRLTERLKADRRIIAATWSASAAG